MKRKKEVYNLKSLKLKIKTANMKAKFNRRINVDYVLIV